MFLHILTTLKTMPMSNNIFLQIKSKAKELNSGTATCFISLGLIAVKRAINC